MSLLIKDGRIITDREDYSADVFIENSKISSMQSNLNIKADHVVNAGNKYVIPGGIDVHTHLDMPLGEIHSTDDFESGTIAAAFGGTTCIIDFPTQIKGRSIWEALELWHEKAEGKACIDYGFHMIVTDISGNRMDELAGLAEEGITSIKLFMAYPGTLMLDDTSIFQIMQYSKESGSLICIHAESGNMINDLVKQALKAGNTEPIYHVLTRPPSSEGQAIEKAITLADESGIPLYLVHLSTLDGLKHIGNARERDITVYAETCPQYLFLSMENMSAATGFEKAKYVFTPPLREKEHQNTIWEGIKQNYIQVIATDHCPFNYQDHKKIGQSDFSKIPNGAPGIEHRMQLLFDGAVLKRQINLNHWIELCATNPAKLFGLYPQKGTIEIGSDADLVIWDPNCMHKISAEFHHMNVDYNLYEGFEVKGKAEMVISNGEIIIEDDQYKGRKGRGKYLKRKLPIFL